MSKVSADAVMNDVAPPTAALPNSDPPRTAAKRLGKKRTSQDKISQLVKFKKKLKRKLDEMEQGELDDEDAYAYMDKIQAKLLQIEKALFDANVYEDALQDPATSLHPPITIANSGFQPLNELLTEFVNDNSNKIYWDNLLGYRHVGPFDVRSMVQKLRSEGFGEEIDQLRGKKSEGTFFTETSEKTNKWCKRSRLSATSDNWIIQAEDWVKNEEMQTLDAHLATENLKAVGLDQPDSGLGPSRLLQAGKTLVEELTRLENNGELQDGVAEPAGAINLDDNKEEDEGRGSSDDEDEQDDGVTGEEVPVRDTTDGAINPVDDMKEVAQEVPTEINLDEDIDLQSDADGDSEDEKDANGGEMEDALSSMSTNAQNGLPHGVAEVEVIQLSDSDDHIKENNDDDDDVQFLS